MNLISKNKIAMAMPALLVSLLACESDITETTGTTDATSYKPPSVVPLEAIVAASNDLLSRPDIPVRGDNGYVEDILQKGAYNPEELLGEVCDLVKTRVERWHKRIEEAI